MHVHISYTQLTHQQDEFKYTLLNTTDTAVLLIYKHRIDDMVVMYLVGTLVERKNEHDPIAGNFISAVEIIKQSKTQKKTKEAFNNLSDNCLDQ